ncbi:serine/threonine-protein kinase [Glycomyces scopariae]|uniref:non-specific serine/threonine protein kinase n=1 Tax=Glycomyces sambucus TaxID=380244 RepID=A0A1G9KHK8_9ACTN|nr:serine/threonine-protein kinase [Glycomyces sambucus]SDL48863.1 serine/threonine-protein kinase PknG [Glycomyces sambucus]
MSDQQPPPEHTQRYQPGQYQQPQIEESDTLAVRRRMSTPPAVPPQPGFAPAPPAPAAGQPVAALPPGTAALSPPSMTTPVGPPQAYAGSPAPIVPPNGQSQQVLPANAVVSAPPAPYRAPAAPMPQPITGPVTRSTTSSTRQRGGLSDMPPVPPRDPAEAVMADPKVPEHKRFCSSCGKPVGRPQAGRGGRVEGFCPHCRARYWFTPSLSPGDLLSDRYEVLGAIAHGGLGWIYLANDRNFADDLTQRWVVIKGLINTSDEDAIEAAINERRFLVGVDHPNVVDIHDFVTSVDPRSGQLQSFIVMEYIAGKSLRDIRDAVDEDGERRPLPLEQVLTYTAELLPAFSYLHDRNLLFCDFKPDNIIHVETWLKLIDLGAVRHAEDMESAIYGTPGYSVPNDEILSVGPSVTSDLYTIGRSMAVLALDFKGFTSTYRDRLPPASEAPQFAEYGSFHRLLLRACHIEPRSRFQDADDMRTQVRGVLHEVQSVQRGEPRFEPSTLFSGEQSVFGEPDVEYDLHAVGDPFDVAHALPSPMVDLADPMAAFLATQQATDVNGILAELNSAPQQSPEVQLRRVRTLVNAGELHQAAAVLDQFAQREGNTWQVTWLRGIISLLAADFATAAAHFDAVYSHLPGELSPRLALAACAELAGRPDLALPHYTRIWACDHRFVSAAYGRARLLDLEGNSTDAITTLHQVPKTSAQYGIAQTAAIQTALHSRTAPPSLLDLHHMAGRLDELKLEPRRRHLVSTRILHLALETVERTGPAGEPPVFGARPEERELRLALERAYRDLAHACTRREDQVYYFDLANRHRPRTML